MAFQRPLGNILVPYGTPYHVTELFLQLLKITFSELPEDHPYRFIPDDYEKSGVAFDVSLNKESEIYGKRPIIVVARGSQNTSPNTVGDLAHVNLPRHGKFGSNLAAGSINVQIASCTKAEVEILGQYVFGLVMMCRTHMPKLLGIHMMQSAVLSEVDKFEDDDTMFVAQMSMQYVSQYIWTQETAEPVLNAIHMGMQRLLQGQQT